MSSVLRAIIFNTPPDEAQILRGLGKLFGFIFFIMYYFIMLASLNKVNGGIYLKKSNDNSNKKLKR